jgi:hypothetical protein
MIIARNLIHDEVILHKLGELQVQLLDAILQTNATSTDFIVDNNREEFVVADDERKEVLLANIEQLAKNQANRIKNISYYENQITYVQSILNEQPTGFVEVDERLKSL